METLLIMLIANSFLLLLTAIFFVLASASLSKSDNDSYQSEHNVSQDIRKIKSQIDDSGEEEVYF